MYIFRFWFKILGVHFINFVWNQYFYNVFLKKYEHKNIGKEIEN